MKRTKIAITNELIKNLYTHVYRTTGGKRCKDFSYGCWNCQKWMAYDILRDSIEMDEATSYD